MNTVLLKAGNFASADEPNDVAVVREDIFDIPAEIGAKEYKVACHHMNYFEAGAGLDKLKEAMVGKVKI